jgi:hypothetical protein
MKPFSPSTHPFPCPPPSPSIHLSTGEKNVAGQEHLQTTMVNFKKILAIGTDLFNSNCIPTAEAIWQVLIFIYLFLYFHFFIKKILNTQGAQHMPQSNFDTQFEVAIKADLPFNLLDIVANHGSSMLKL